MTKRDQLLILDTKQIERVLSKIAHDIVKSAGKDVTLAIIGIRSNGDYLASRLARIIKSIGERTIDIGYMDITLYRDDLMTNPEHPEIKTTDILFSLEDKLVILVDDVLFTGRTIRAALNQIPDYGRPKAVKLAALIDRGGRELPIQADYVGKTISTTKGDDVIVSLRETGGNDEVILKPRAKTGSTEAKPRKQVKK